VDNATGHNGRRRAQSVLPKRRLTGLVGHLLQDASDLGAHLEHDPMMARIAKSPRGRQARQCGQGDTGNPIDKRIDILSAHQFMLLLHQAELKHFGLNRDVRSVSLRAGGLLPLSPQVA
jgi:hypothetical protein